MAAEIRCMSCILTPMYSFLNLLDVLFCCVFFAKIVSVGLTNAIEESIVVNRSVLVIINWI